MVIQCNSTHSREKISRTTSSPPQVVLPDEAVGYNANKWNNRSLQQASHHEWPSNVIVHTQEEQFPRTILSSPQQVILPYGANANQRNAGTVLPEQQTIVPPERIFRRHGKQPIVQTERKRKSPLSSLALVEKERGIITNIAKDNTKIGGQSNSITASTQRDKQKGIFLKKIHYFRATNIKLLCCHFNTPGEFLATGGHDNKTYRNLEGHHGHVMSVDYHTTKVGLLSSCDHNNEIRLWNVNWGDCILSLKDGSTQVRFQPKLGDLLASSTENIINIFDIETKNIQKILQFLELWNPMSKRDITSSYSAHDGIISSLADSPAKGIIASVSYDQWIRSKIDGLCTL